MSRQLVGSVLALALLAAGCGQPTVALLRSRKPVDVRQGLVKIKQEEDPAQLRQSVRLLVEIFHWTSAPGGTSHLGIAALDTLATIKVGGASGLAMAFNQPLLRKKLVSALYKRYTARGRVASPDKAKKCSTALGLLVRQWRNLGSTQRAKVVTIAVRQRCTTARAWLQKRFKRDKLAWYGIMAVDTCRQLDQIWYSFKSRGGLIGSYAAALRKVCALDKTVVSAVGARTIARTHSKMAKVFKGIGTWPVPDGAQLDQGQAGLDRPFPTVARKLRLSGIGPNVAEAAEAFCGVTDVKLQGRAWKNFRLRSGLLGRLLLWEQIKAADCLKGGCAHSAECGSKGLCTAGAEGLACLAGSDNDCRGSDVCTNSGRCKAVKGKCVAADARSCKASTGCSKRGGCTAVKGACVAASDEDCQQADVCIASGRCRAAKGKCSR